MDVKRLAKFLAIHYRFNSSAQGCWKEFGTKEEAEGWLLFRKNKSLDSPKGGIIFNHGHAIEDLELLIKNGKEVPANVKSAIKSYLAFKEL